MMFQFKNLCLPESFPDTTDIIIQGSKVLSLGLEILTPDITLEFNGAVAFPGLINAHDHLEFNLFPQLNNRVYQDYVEWGEDIHKHNQAEIAAVLKIPVRLRLQWGLFKNLLSGVTTVAHHGVYHDLLDNNLINVFLAYRYLHSLRLHPYWKLKMNLPFSQLPIMAHIAEGTNVESEQEPDLLIKWNWLRSELIGIHAIAMNERQAREFKALVWCPVSNFLLYGRTAAVDRLKKHTTVLFGTDSTVSSGWNMWQHLRTARQLGCLTDAELYASLNQIPAKILLLKNTGQLRPGYAADITIARPHTKKNFWDAFFHVDPENILLVMKSGRVLLFDEELSPQFKPMALPSFDRVVLGSKTKMVSGGIAELVKSIKEFQPDVAFPVELE